MLIPGLADDLNLADSNICAALDTVRRLCEQPTWQGCAETSEIEALNLRIDLINLRNDLLLLQRQYGLS